MIIEKLEELQQNMNDIAGSWNGDEDTFYYAGSQYHESDAVDAVVIATKAGELIKLIKAYEEED